MMSSSPLAMPRPGPEIPPTTDESPGAGRASNERRRQETVGLFYAIVFVLLVVSLGLLEVAAS
jgi:hypothetical protein